MKVTFNLTVRGKDAPSFGSEQGLQKQLEKEENVRIKNQDVCLVSAGERTKYKALYWQQAPLNCTMCST